MQIKIVNYNRHNKPLTKLIDVLVSNLNKKVDVKLVNLKNHYRSVGVASADAQIKQEREIINELDSSYLMVESTFEGKTINQDDLEYILETSKQDYRGNILFLINPDKDLANKLKSKLDVHIKLSNLEMSGEAQLLVLCEQLDKIIKNY